MNTDNFKEEIIDNPDVKQCIITIVKDHCHACKNAKLTSNILSRKLHKNGFLDQIPMFYTDIHNINPHLINSMHSPNTIFLKKEGSQIVEIKTLTTPLSSKVNKFITEVEEVANLPGLSDKIKVDMKQHISNYYNAEDLSVDYDIDFDRENVI